MSESFAHEGQFDPDGWAPTTGGSLDEALAAEIEDHLAAAAGDFVRRGAATDEALQMALARFGNVDRIKRQCWWIHKGDEVMIRTFGIAILGLLTVSVVAVAVGGWQLGRNLASRTEELSEQLASLTATQQAMLVQQKPPTVSGRCYLGDPSKPAKNVEVQVFRFSEEPRGFSFPREPGVIARRLRTDSDGRFESGILQAGEYCLLAPILAPDGSANEKELPFDRLQSRPLNLIAGVGESKIDLDLSATGQVQLVANGIPSTIVVGGEEVSLSVNLTLSTEDEQRYVERKPVPPSDEPPREGWPMPLTRSEWDIAAAGARVQNLPLALRLMPRKYSGHISVQFVAKLFADHWEKMTMSGMGGMGGVSVSPDAGAMGGTVKGPLSAGTKLIPVSIAISPGANSTLTISVIGEPLEQRIEAMIREWEKSNPMKLGEKESNQAFLTELAKSIELKVEESRTDSSAKK